MNGTLDRATRQVTGRHCPRVIFLLDSDSEYAPPTSGSILFEDLEEDNELPITLIGTSVTKRSCSIQH